MNHQFLKKTLTYKILHLKIECLKLTKPHGAEEHI